MAYVINTDCIECGACIYECPTDTISSNPRPKPGEAGVKINPDCCIECGACFNICPVDAPNPA